MPRRIVFLRHGRTAHNADGRIQGQLDIGLDETGRAQAAALAAAWQATPPTVIVSSDLERARDTAAVIATATGQPLLLDVRLRELDLGSWQGLTSAEAAQRFPQDHAAWHRGEDVARGGGETYAQAGARAVACALDLLPPAGMLLAVTHGGTARGAIGTLLELPADTWWRLAPLGNTCWTVLVEADRGWRLERHAVGVDLGAGPEGTHDVGALSARVTAGTGLPVR